MTRIIWRIIDAYILLLLIILLSILDKLLKIFMKKEAKSQYKKILIIKLSALGDTIMMIPILRALRYKLPNACISVLVTKLNEGVIINCPYLDKIKVLDLDNPISALRTVIELRKQRYDLVIDFEQRIKVSSLIAYFTGSAERIGFKTKGYFRHYLYTKEIFHKKERHEFVCMSELVGEITGKIEDIHLEFWVSDDDRKWVESFLRQYNLIETKLIVLHPGCGAKYIKGARAREWPRERFAQLGDVLSKVYNAQILITGGQDELDLAREVASKIEAKNLILSGKLDIGKLAALLQRCFLLISGDTGIMHLGAACGIKTIAIFGPTDPNRCVPLSGSYHIVKADLPCMPCQVFGTDRPGCNIFACIKSVSVKDILNSL